MQPILVQVKPQLKFGQDGDDTEESKSKVGIIESQL